MSAGAFAGTCDPTSTSTAWSLVHLWHPAEGTSSTTPLVVYLVASCRSPAPIWGWRQVHVISFYFCFQGHEHNDLSNDRGPVDPLHLHQKEQMFMQGVSIHFGSL